MMAPDPFKTTPRFEKIAFSCQDDPLPTRIANSSSTKVVSFSSACTTKRFPSPRCASAIQIVRTLERCPQCGGQALYCECPYDDDLIDEPRTKTQPSEKVMRRKPDKAAKWADITLQRFTDCPRKPRHINSMRCHRFPSFRPSGSKWIMRNFSGKKDAVIPPTSR